MASRQGRKEETSDSEGRDMDAAGQDARQHASKITARALLRKSHLGDPPRFTAYHPRRQVYSSRNRVDSLHMRGVWVGVFMEEPLDCV